MGFSTSLIPYKTTGYYAPLDINFWGGLRGPEGVQNYGYDVSLINVMPVINVMMGKK